MSPSRRALVRTRRRALFAALLIWLPAALAQDWPAHTPFFATPERVVEAMLTLAQVKPEDIVYDLGSGDGRIVIAAARRGARAVGIDIDPGWTRIARRNAEAAKLADRATFETGDAFEADLRRATVVTLYLPADITTALRPKLSRELTPGTRIVSHDYLLGDWKPVRTEIVTAENGRKHPIYLWIAP
jgi:SAM-dependent methyltransferase